MGMFWHYLTQELPLKVQNKAPPIRAEGKTRAAQWFDDNFNIQTLRSAIDYSASTRAVRLVNW
jgi:hypothetical protein